MLSEFQVHTFSPVYNRDSHILILGTFPSVKSRESSFYYGHPQNRFWRVLADLFNCETPKTVKDKTDFLLSHNIAVWDVIKSCEITGSSDSTIKRVTPNDISLILNNSSIKAIYANGKTAEKLYNKYLRKTTKREIIALPSTSPANAAFTIDKLIKAWQIIIENI